MSGEYELIATQSSYYSAKPRACLQYKRIPYVERQCNVERIGGIILPKTGSHYLPVLVCPDGEVVQDSITIVETLEARHPGRPVIPEDPVYVLVAYVFDTLSDEFFGLTGGSQRWATEEARDWGFRLFRHTLGNDIVHAESVGGVEMMVASAATNISSRVGALQARYPEFDAACLRFSEALYDRLEAHLRERLFLLGDRPCLADLSMMNTMFGHIYRDPGPATEYVRRQCIWLSDWVDRMHAAAGTSDEGELGLSDSIVEVLAYAGEASADFFERMLDAAPDALAGVDPRQTFPPSSTGGEASGSMPGFESELLGAKFGRGVSPYTLWKLQRLRERYASMPADRLAEADALIERMGWSAVFRHAPVPRLEKKGFQIQLAI